MKKTLFLQSTELDKLQAKVNEHEAQGWAFFSLTLGIAPRAVAGAGSAPQVVLDMVGQPRLYVAALQRDEDAAK